MDLSAVYLSVATPVIMPIQLLCRDGKRLPLKSPQALEEIFGIKYLPHLAFENAEIKRKIQVKVKRALEKKWITPHQKWLGEYFSYGIRNGVHLDLTIKWINEDMGYGLFTNQDIQPHVFVGEYTGLLRKRKFFGRWKNHYCFIYNCGEARHTRYTIDAEKQGNFTRFINHSEERNLEVASVYCDGLMHIIVYTLKKIPAHTQLFYDYGPDYWTKRKKPII